jgi:hypothetical protein
MTPPPLRTKKLKHIGSTHGMLLVLENPHFFPITISCETTQLSNKGKFQSQFVTNSNPVCYKLKADFAFFPNQSYAKVKKELPVH